MENREKKGDVRLISKREMKEGREVWTNGFMKKTSVKKLRDKLSSVVVCLCPTFEFDKGRRRKEGRMSVNEGEGITLVLPSVIPTLPHVSDTMYAHPHTYTIHPLGREL